MAELQIVESILNPQTPQEWQESVNYAGAAMLMQFAVEIKFIEGPEVDLERCITIMLLGKQRSIEPDKEIVLEIFVSMLRGIDGESAWELANTIWQMAQQAITKRRK